MLILFHSFNPFMGECVQTSGLYLQDLCDAVMPTWPKISEECCEHIVESVPQSMKAEEGSSQL